MLRLAALALALAAVPASAQARFLESCAAAPDLEGIDGVEPAALCSCVAQRSVARGIPASVLDQSIDYPTVEALEGAPDEIKAAAEIALESTVGCLLAQQSGSAFGPASGAPAAAASGPSQGGPAAPAPAPAPDVARLPSGLRTGNGRAPVRVEQQGSGAAIRIVG